MGRCASLSMFGGVFAVVVGLVGLTAGASEAAAQAAGVGFDSTVEPETGRLLGKVIQSVNAEPVPQAHVSVEGGPSALTDLNGRFLFRSIPAGVVNVTVQALGYGEKIVTGVEVVAGELTNLDIAVEEQAIEVEGIRVSAEREQGSTAFLLNERRAVDAMVEAVGSQEISRRPDSDAADVAQRMTGVTVSDGKYVFIRGLGERYSQTTLNGSSLPSPEPEREVVPLDLFPSGFLESLQTQKSYTPNLPADFSGGAVQIQTKDFPSHFAGRLSVSTSANTNSQFKDEFLHYRGGGGLDWLGIDNGARSQPEAVEAAMGGVRSGRRLPTDPAQLVVIGEALKGMEQQFAPIRGTTPMNRGIDFSIGGRSDVGAHSEIGYFLAGTYSDQYTIRDGEVERKWRAAAFREETADLSTPNVDYTFARGTRNVSWGTIGNVAFKPSPGHQIALKTTFNLTTDDEARTYTGVNSEDIGGEVYSERSRFVERRMGWAQLSGEHLFFLDSRVDWRLTGARANRNEPLLRETIYLRDGVDQEYLLLDYTESARYFASELVDDDASAELDWSVPISFLGRTGAVKLGGAFRDRQRDFGARRLNWNFLGSTISDLDSALASSQIVDRAPTTGEFAIDEVVEPGDVYGVTDRRMAGYAMVELPVGDRLQAVVGARVESYDLQLDSRGETLQELEQTDIAPSLNLAYSLGADIKLRGAISRTLDRPEFRELAPFQFTEATSLRQMVGNPNLKPAEITSADLRLDWFWGPREILSIGGFYKEMTAPIERVFIAAASSAYSFQNAESATVVGVETDLQLGLGRVSQRLQNVAFQANYSWIHSEVKVRSGGIFQPTNLERPLEGQAPYVVNVGLNYADQDGLEAGVFFNRFGQRLAAAGGSGLPDIYEQPRNSFDGSLGFPIRAGLRARVKGTNLLDVEYQYLQEANGITRTQRSYSVGRTFSVGLSWEF